MDAPDGVHGDGAEKGSDRDVDAAIFRLFRELSKNGEAHIISAAGVDVQIVFRRPESDCSARKDDENGSIVTFTADIGRRHVGVYMYPMFLDESLSGVVRGMLFNGAIMDVHLWGISFSCEVDGVRRRDARVEKAVAMSLSQSGNLDIEFLLG